MEVSHHEVRLLNDAVRSGDASRVIPAGRLRDDADLILVRLGNRWVKAIWDPQRGELKTILGNRQMAFRERNP